MCEMTTGQFEVVCKVADHYQAGMRANYTVNKCSIFNRQSEMMLHQSKYYIAAVEVEWDYSPSRTWEDGMYKGLKDRYKITPLVTDRQTGLWGNQKSIVALTQMSRVDLVLRITGFAQHYVSLVHYLF